MKLVEWTIILCVSVSINLKLDVCSVPDTLHCFCLAAPNTFLFYCYLQARKIKNRNARELKFFQTTARQKVFLFKYMYILKIICIFIYNRFWYWKVVFTLLNFLLKFCCWINFHCLVRLAGAETSGLWWIILRAS